jgi:hypothetical protein
MINMTKGDQDIVRLNRFSTMVEVGLGCDFYLPFFKLIPELKFCFGLADILVKNRKDLTDMNMLKYTQSLDKASNPASSSRRTARRPPRRAPRSRRASSSG